ncbi:MAG: DNA integrity scanning diadenylate cyclase DisA [Acidimicrobiia bacterium]
MTPPESAPLEILRRFAPGTPLRNAAELVMQQGTGALILFGSGPEVDDVCTGGFELSGAAFTAQRVAELAKMDGGIVVDDQKGAIVRANVHFMPDASIATAETGTRFRTAERLSIQTGCPVLALSEEALVVAIVFYGPSRFMLQSTTSLLDEANQRLQSLERLRRQFDDAVARLERYEVDGIVSFREVVSVVQRAAVIRLLAMELEPITAELGDQASVISLQASDLIEGVDEIAELVNIDYQKRKPRKETSIYSKLDGLDRDDLFDPFAVGAALGFQPTDSHVAPRGARVLAGVPRLPDSVADAILRKFGSFERLRVATASDLDSVDGVGPTRAQTIRAYLDRLEEVGLLGDVVN